ncbi:MAG: winged helix-turn-helix transcriptional regulator [Chloroflexi bacterium]|nr:winged helix-turn-helix transcriptional regulator [Chloroflexota bacterium]
MHQLSAMTTKQVETAALAARMQQLMYTLVRNFRQCDQMCVSRHGITVSQSSTLMAFPLKSEITMNELSETMGLANSTMTRAVDHLVQKDLVTRRQDDRDRRVVLVGLSPEGQELRRRLETEKQLLFQELVRDIPEEQRAATLHALVLVIEVLAKADRDDLLLRWNGGP